MTSIGRASPLAPADRQAMIIDAVIPLLLEHGNAVTSKQIAEAAGIAEGTVFRAFKDKDTLIEAAALRFLDAGRFRDSMRAIDETDPLEVKIRRVLELLLERFSDVFRMMAVVGHRDPRKGHADRREYAEILERVLAPDLENLAMTPDRISHILRLLAFSASVPHLNNGSEFSLDELTEFVLHGIGRTSRPER
jgi:AcrR family transcriptional regulator